MRIDDQVFSSKHLLINSQFDPSRMSYRITGILVWAPDISNDGQTLYCDIVPPTQPTRRKRSSSQIASITLTVKRKINILSKYGVIRLSCTTLFSNLIKVIVLHPYDACFSHDTFLFHAYLTCPTIELCGKNNCYFTLIDWCTFIWFVKQ